tara:strand:- start:1985 stop:2344 length:360 start_codon:yes stop_codon:yes gene_type:complete
MEAKDLMIGNLLSYEQTTHRVISINGKSIRSVWKGNQRIDEYDDFVFHYKPIPLTEEWLLKFGFDNSLVKDIFLALDCNVIYDEGKYYFRRRGFQMVINHVHQLQNLYKALTNEDLKIK